MKRGGMAALLMAALFVCPAAHGSAQRIEVYAAEGALADGQAEGMVRLLSQAFPEAEWTIAPGEESLRQRVMAGRAPGLAVCAPGEAMPWAREGMLLPLDGRISSAVRIQKEALEPGVFEEKLFAAPLVARHRRMAVNADRIEEMQMRHLLDGAAYPVWLPQQLEQVLEECRLSGMAGMEVWPAEEGEADAMAALVQAFYGGAWMTEDGEIRADDPAACLGAQWLYEMVESGAIARAENREAALEHFLDGKTAMFIDWTDEDEKLRRKMPDGVVRRLAMMPYPSAEGVPVRSFELTGVSAFRAEDEAENALLLKAVSFLHEDGAAQLLFGSRGIWRDGTIWLRYLKADDRGATLARLTREAMRAVIEEGVDACAAFEAAQAAMCAAGYAK